VPFDRYRYCTDLCAEAEEPGYMAGCTVVVQGDVTTCVAPPDDSGYYACYLTDIVPGPHGPCCCDTSM
jgi:hypothetical protein